MFVEGNYCKLVGNVKVEQTKKKAKDFPVLVESQAAFLNFKTEKITFLGTTTKPVSTIIELEGNPLLEKKSKERKNKKNRRI